MALELLSRAEEERDPALVPTAREAVIATDTPAAQDSTGPAGMAVSLRAVLPRSTALTDAERALLQEWLDRIAQPLSERNPT